MKRAQTRLGLSCCLLIILKALSLLWGPPCNAAPQQQKDESPAGLPSADDSSDGQSSSSDDLKPRDLDEPQVGDNDLGLRFLRNLMTDQEAIWTSPAHLQWGDASWLLPMGEVTAGLLATDRASDRALPTNPGTLSRYRSFSNYGLGAFAGATVGLYALGKITHDDHKRETGVLAIEAAIDSLAVNSTLEYSFGREAPYQDQGRVRFFQGGDAFPSDHAALAFSMASVIAHEYPGPLTELLAYGAATAISTSRVMGRDHSPSDVLVGAGIGWLIGHEVYRKHHDPDLGGGGWEDLSGGVEAERNRDRRSMGSPFVPLDSWVYPALDRLAALGYVTSSTEGLKPWTRMECAVLAEEAREAMSYDAAAATEAAGLVDRLEREFAYETDRLSGGKNATANLDSIYARTVSISGPDLTDGYHFGQTISDDFGRPYERGTNLQDGGEFSAAIGPITIDIRAEYQHAPSAPPLSAEVRNFISEKDVVPLPPGTPIAAIDRAELLDTYLAIDLGNFEISIGRQSLSWGPGLGGSFLWSDNIEPVDMVRLVNPEAFTLPGLLHFLGPARFDQFFGRLGGHEFIREPFMYGQKINFKPLPNLELGFGRTTTIGGQGPGATPLTPGNFIYSFFGQIPNGSTTVPGDSHSSMDWTFYVPKVRNYLVFYGDLYADDDFLPIENPPKNPFRPGIYITRFPGLSKLDLHVEVTSTESPGLKSGNTGDLNYYNFNYRDGYTNDGNLIGNTVGRMGEAYQAWLTYWISPRNTLQFAYKDSHVDPSFVPGGGAWQDYSLRSEWYLRSGFYLKSQLQYENISHFPILFSGPQRNVTAIVEAGFMPWRKK
jgi:membrane-associated phospholipid phosphatase